MFYAIFLAVYEYFVAHSTLRDEANDASRQRKLLSPTLTTSKEWGIVFVAFLKLLVRFAGSHLWGIVCFLRALNAIQNDAS
jgi:hypothetical protein